jgi:hypothetical protein
MRFAGACARSGNAAPRQPFSLETTECDMAEQTKSAFEPLGGAGGRSPADARPTDPDLPMRRRTRAWPMLIGVLIVAVIAVALIAFGSYEAAQTPADVVLTPGSPGNSAPIGQSGEQPAAGTQPNPQQPTETPGAADVPGGG